MREILRASATEDEGRGLPKKDEKIANGNEGADPREIADRVHEEVELRKQILKQHKEAVKEQGRLLPISEFFGAVGPFCVDLRKAVMRTTVEERYLEEIKRTILGTEGWLRGEEGKKYQAWAEKRLADRDSWLSSHVRNIGKMHEIASRAEEADERLAFLDCPNELKEYGMDSRIVDRVRRIEENIHALAQKVSVSAEKVFSEYALEEAWKQSEASVKRGLVSRVLKGGKVSAAEAYKRIVREALVPEYADEVQNGITKKERLIALLPRNRFEKQYETLAPEAFDGAPYDEKLKAIIWEVVGGRAAFQAEVRKPKMEGLQEYMEAVKLPKEFKQIFEVLNPVLGRNAFVSKIQFVSGNRAEAARGSAADFVSATRVVSLYRSNFEKDAAIIQELARVLAHETGHAMDLEKKLPLREAMEFGVEMIESVKTTGFVSEYSENAQEVYLQKYKKRGTSLSAIAMNKKTRDFIANASLDEEWAEMVGYGMTSGTVKGLHPEKWEMVKKYCKKFGMDFEEAHAKMVSLLLSEADREKERLEVR